jgi:hypothetical protein
MRCYFNLVKASEVIRDLIGVEISGPEEAYAHALQAVREQCGAKPDWDGWTLIAVTDSGRLLFSIALDEPKPYRVAAVGWLLPLASAEPFQDLSSMLSNALALATILT